MKFTSCLLICIFAIPAINASYPISAFKNGMLQVFPPGIDGQLYGYPDDKIGGMIIEGPFPYENGPLVWSKTNITGAYGLINAAANLVDGKCPPIPSTHPLFKSGLQPVPFTNGANNCQIGCNLTEISQTGVDPCKPGSIDGPTDSPMSCFDVGPGFAGGWGLCGYNCTALNYNASKSQGKLVYCRDINSSCNIACDTRNFPAEESL
jgi:hypothetical protein